MFNPKEIRIADFAYELPDKRIAKYPLAERDASKLLVYRSGKISHSHFRDLPGLLPEGSLVVMNNTRVIQARLHFRKAAPEGQKGALIEVFCLEPAQPADYVLMFQQTGSCTWHCLVGNAKKWKAGALRRSLDIGGQTIALSAERLDGDLIRFSWDSDTLTWAQVLEACGELPIPPYLNRQTEESDLKTYQTVYSKVKGSVAAPTAGLHFTPAVLSELTQRGIERAELTLHVGAGTFKPVKSERIEGHEMHAEWVYVPRSAVEALLNHGGECTAVGTTSVRTLESLYYIGKKITANPEATEDELKVMQWEPYENDEGKMISHIQALRAILGWMDRHGTDALHTSTQIIIAPGYRYHYVRRMITNFHQPQSTLLLLVSAFVGGNRWRDIYRYALDNDFRFLSYGDSSLLEPTGEEQRSGIKD
ncbi:MAG: S-adenosylmethionine:tRNA ribosyltransferase-isomerase [Bacteroidaceae bacterium]|nr:S-adenosylmethionine:tRNA ribosyltransferase-isomerase [Bacteroidaceae bacterium]